MTTPSFTTTNDTTSFTTLPTSSQSTTSLTSPSLAPSSLDTLPLLSSILLRLQPPNSLHSIAPSPAPASQAAATDVFSTTTLSTKDLPTATDTIRSRLAKAKTLVAGLPDLDRGLDEQEAEIRELEGRIREQREVLEKLRRSGEKAAAP